MSGKGTHPTELAWAKHLAGESGWLASWRLRRHVASCASCRQTETEMALERSAFDAAPQRRVELAALLQARAAGSARGASRLSAKLPWVVATCAAAAAIVVVATRAPVVEPLLVEKGGGALALYVDRPAGALALGGRCAPGDRLIARYRTERPYLLLLERDGSGAVQVLLPPGGTMSVKVAAAEGTTPTSWILDGAPGRECFAAFFSDEPIEATLARTAFLESAETPALPGVSVRVQCCEKAFSR